jgi:3-hydroxyacyl-CoA dehydrogenase
MNFHIRKVAVLGSGVMGSRIACHFANAGFEVLLLDIIPNELTTTELENGLTLETTAVRNRIVSNAIKSAVSSSPAALYSQNKLENITIGNFEDDLAKIKDCEWVIEAIIENLELKNNLFEKVEQHRKPGTIISSNTSGIPITSMTKNRTEDFKLNFCGTHFFNPPRYLQLLEIIPTNYTTTAVIDFLMDFGDRFLGKTTVLCKDSPAFIANRIGVFGIMHTLQAMEKFGFSIEEVDYLTGPVIGRPKSATFRTCDVVGIDTLIKVANGLIATAPTDESIDKFKAPAYIQKLLDNKWLGDKANQGFYKKVKNELNKTEILVLDPISLNYVTRSNPKWKEISELKNNESLSARLKILILANSKVSQFYQDIFCALFVYAANRIPEIADFTYQIDFAIKAGFGWELGPFEMWDILGWDVTSPLFKQLNIDLPGWVVEMASQKLPFYKVEGSNKLFYDFQTKNYKSIESQNGFLILENFSNQIVWKNEGTIIKDIGDGVINIEFNTKMNSIGGEVLAGVNKAIDLAEKSFAGLVIGNNGVNFSAGANVAMLFMLALEQEFDELDFAVRYFQNTSMRIRYSAVPIVVATQGLTLGGGCEFVLHADSVVSAAESYIGLVESGVGIVPAGGGTKEFAYRASQSYFDGDVQLPTLQKRFLDIAMAKVSTSAAEAFDLGILRKGIDSIVLNKNRVLAIAKQKVIGLSSNGYCQPIRPTTIKVLGRTALGAMLTGANAMHTAGYISLHDKLVAEKLAYVICGGDLTGASLVSEQYLLDLEREAFLYLISTPKTLERLQSIITKGKPLRN